MRRGRAGRTSVGGLDAVHGAREGYVARVEHLRRCLLRLHSLRAEQHASQEHARGDDATAHAALLRRMGNDSRTR